MKRRKNAAEVVRKSREWKGGFLIAAQAAKSNGRKVTCTNIAKSNERNISISKHTFYTITKYIYFLLVGFCRFKN